MEEDLIPYPLLAAEFPGVTLDCDILATEDEVIHQGHAEDAAAQNMNLELLDIIRGVDGLAIINAHNDKIEYNYDNDYIVAVAKINQEGAPQLQPIVQINNTNNNANTDNNTNNGKDDNDSSNDDNNSIEDDDKSIKTSVINFDQGNQNDDKNDNKN